MKNILILLIALFTTSVQAQDACPTPEEKILVVFGNGTLTSADAALRSLDALQEAIGPIHKNQKLSYDLAYNHADVDFADFLQSATQETAQFDSHVMAWINHIQGAPDWFNSLLQRLYVAIYTVNAPDLAAHVAKYQQAIIRGQRVLVISHAQGNLYVNEEKKLLRAALTPEQMNSFSILAVATPANNVGGKNAPYFTNHRDIILLAPGALPENWALHHAGGTLADDLPRLQAYDFVDTYMSMNYDMRPALILKIQEQLNNLKVPMAVCDNYRKQFLGLLAGSYFGDCLGNPSSVVSIDKNAVVSFPDGIVDLSGPNVWVNMSRKLINTNEFDTRGINFSGTAVTGNAGGDWSSSGDFKKMGGCNKSDRTPASAIPAPVDFAAKVAELLNGYRGGFPASRCVIIKSEKVLAQPVGWQAVAVNGTIVSIAGADHDMTGARISEILMMAPANGSEPNDYDPNFSFSADFVDGGKITIEYKSIKGMQLIAYEKDSAGFFCIPPND